MKTHRRKSQSHAIGALLAAGALLWCPMASATDPKVPPGIDPGGTGVAIVGDGFDYRGVEVRSRLARDGEGELIGWDFVDGDRTPFAAGGAHDAIARLLVAASPARLVLVRVARGDERQVASALRLLGDTPAQVVLLVADTGAPIERAKLTAAARALPRLLIVVPLRLVKSEAGAKTGDHAGLLVVTSDASPDADATAPVASGAIALPSGVPTDDLAAAQVAALAARVLSREPSLEGSVLRARLLSLATSEPGGRKVFQRIEALP